MLTTRYHLDEAHLSYYDEKLKSWASSQPVKTLPSSLYPWTLTEKAGAVTCWPVGGTQLKPTVDFLFTEVPPASGDKGPENPSMITGVSSVKVGCIGKNLLLAVPDNTDWYGISITRQADGSYLLNGTSWSSQQNYFSLTDSGNLSGGPYSSLRLDPLKTYTLSARIVSGTKTGGAAVSALSTRSMNWIAGSAMQLVSGSVVTATRSASSLVTGEFICRLNVESGASFNNVVLQVQLEEGSTATDFEAPMLPADSNHVLPLGSTYYGGTLDVASGVMTVTHEGVVIPRKNIENAPGADFSGVFNLSVYNLVSSGKQANVFSYNESAGYNSSNYSSNYYPWERSGAIANTFHTSANFGYISVSGSSIENARQNLLSVYDTAVASGNPISFVYPLATPYTVQFSLAEILSLAQTDKYTPRLNTLYTDAQSVQVGYVKSPIREEYELTQAIVGQGGNI